MITKSYCWRKTAVALAAFALLGLSTSNALALSLGSMTVRSALGEPLRAEIDITNITQEEINSFSIRVAPPDAFVSAGLEYNSVLKNTLATLQRRPGGGHYIRLSSNSPINEPYLDLILEANSSSGRVARDYPMLFDPPVRSQNATATATAAANAPIPVLAQIPVEPDIEPFPSYPTASPSYPTQSYPSQATQVAADSAQPASAYRIPIIDDSPRPMARAGQMAGDGVNARNISETSPAAGPSAVGGAMPNALPNSSASVGDAMSEEFPDFSQLPINAATSDGRTTARQPTTKPGRATTVAKRVKPRAIARLRHSTRPAAIQTATADGGDNGNSNLSKTATPASLTVGTNPSSVVVKRGDTVTKIAEAVKPANVSLDDMLAALVRANPDAFINNDPNRIRVGAVLKVPGTEGGGIIGGNNNGGDSSTQSLTAESQNFDKYRRNLATQAPHTPTEGASRKAMGRIQTQVEERNAIAAAPDKLTLSKGAVQGKSSEIAIANERATKETSTRAADINKNIADLQKLGASSPTLPALPASAVVPPASAARPASAASIAASASLPLASAARPASGASGPASVALPASAVVAASSPASAVVPASAASTVASAMSSASLPASGSALPASAASAGAAAGSGGNSSNAGKAPTMNGGSPSMEPPGLLDDLLGSEDMMLPVAGGVGVLLAGLGGLAFWRSRKRKEDMLAEESSFIESRIPPDSFFGASGGQHVDTSQEEDEHNSSAMIYSPSQLNAIDDVDPVAEADVYLAYGRDVQAEEILREALLTNPGRAAIHTKLLEILAKRQDTEAFETAATQASQIVKKDSPEWAHICEMGQSFDPSNALYQLGRPIASEQGMHALPASLTAASSMAAMEADSAAAEAEAEQSDVDLDLDLDFSTDDDDAPTIAPSAVPSLSTALDNSPVSISAPLSIPPLRPEPEPEPAPPPLPTHDLNINLDAALDMEFDLSAPVAPAPAPAQPSAPEPLDDSAQSLEEMFNLNFDEPPNAFALPNAGAPKAATPPPATSIPANPDGNGALLEFNLDDFQLPGTTPAPAGGGTIGGRLEDPLETKLALAQEFVAIGDEFGAREILEEVIASATGDLQAKARAALAKLG